MLVTLLATLPVLAQAAGPRGYTVSWAVILLAIVLALVVALRPAKREQEVRRRKAD